MKNASGETCIDCPAPVSTFSRTGRCRSCSAKANRADPAMNERRLAALRVVKASPEGRAVQSAARKRLIEERKNDPEWQAYLRKQGQRLYRDFCAHPDALKRRSARSAAARRDKREQEMAWCPQDRRDEYHRLRKHSGAAEARRIILEDIAASERRRLAEMDPLERQMERLANGARLVPAFTAKRADHDFTLGGIAPEAM